MINPRMFDNMSWRMAEVYGACVDRLLVNIAHYFPYIQAGQEPRGTFDYMVRMLANMGQVNRESVRIIEQSLQGEDEALRGMLMSAIRDVIMDIDPTLRKAAEQGLLGRVAQPVLDPSTTQAFRMFYKQSADKLNLVNTVMLESTEHAYQSTVSDIVYRVNAQGVLNSAAGQVVTGVETWNRAMNLAVAEMAQKGLTGFIDHAGRHWSPEAYVAMDIRTTVSNTARAAVWEQNEEYGNDMYSVSSHNGARPLCYPWQGKVISRSDTVRDVEDLQGNRIHVYAQSETSYGEPAGLFGINCGHYPYPFIPGMSMVRGEPQDPEENEKTYQESQEQRRLERELRTAKRDLAVEKARGAPKEVLREKKDKVDQARGKLDDFCEKTGRHRRSAREGTPINARFPDKGSYTVGDMPQTVRNQMREFYQQQAQPIPPTAPVAQTPAISSVTQNPVFQPVPHTLTPDERSAVEAYVSGDRMDINQILRGSGGEMRPDERELVKDLDSALADPLGKPQTLFRSVDAEAVFGKMSQLQYEQMRDAVVYHDNTHMKTANEFMAKVQGRTITEKGYMSTTKDFEIASEWGGFTGSDKPIVLKLNVPGSTRGRDLVEFEVEGEEQKEVLLSRGQKYRVTGYGSENGSIIVYADILEE